MRKLFTTAILSIFMVTGLGASALAAPGGGHGGKHHQSRGHKQGGKHHKAKVKAKKAHAKQHRRAHQKAERRAHHKAERRAHKRHQRAQRARYYKAMPRAHRRVVHRGTPYYYHDGGWYVRDRVGYVLVSSPIGAIVVDVPTWAERRVVRDRQYYFVDGSWYRYEPARRHYVVVTAPM